MNVRPRKTKELSMRITEELKTELEVAAQNQKRSVGEIVHNMLESKFAHGSEQPLENEGRQDA